MMNSLPNRWRFRYNEDTDMTLQVLADGWCSILFNSFMIQTNTTMTSAGGQTAIYLGDGRLQMARQLERVWPGVVTTIRRFNRPQHSVKSAWRKFDNKLIRRKDIDWDAIEKGKGRDYGIKVQAVSPVKSDDLRKLVTGAIPKAKPKKAKQNSTAGVRLDSSVRSILDDMKKRNAKMEAKGIAFRPELPILFTKIGRTASESLNRLLKESCLDYVRLGHLRNAQIFYAHSGTEHISICHNHIPIQYLRASGIMPDAAYDSRFVFGFVRNPWDRLASFWRVARAGNVVTNVELVRDAETFEDFVRNVYKFKRARSFDPNAKNYLLIHPQWRWLLPDFDFIGRYEYLSKDIKALGKEIGVEDMKLQHRTKMHNEPDDARLHYLDMYDKKDLIDIVADVYADDIEILGYNSLEDQKPNSQTVIKRKLAAHWRNL
jgi:hypothetical protein